MGVIYKAEDPDIGRTVAIKLVRADLLDGEDRDDFLARFRHEARAAGRCTHPNIVALYDFALHEGNPFLAMEFIDGPGLGQALKQVGRFPAPDAVAIAVQLLDALGAAHLLGVVHRDVKPANILVLPTGQIKVTDFGISRLNTSDLTQDGTVIGTPAYMSPEQCRGDPVDARSDLFSVGTVLYELLTGTRAFTGRNATEVTFNVLTADPPDVTAVAADVPPALSSVLRQAMAKDRDARYASAQAMADGLRAALREDVPSAVDQTVVMATPRAVFTAAVTAPAVDDATLGTIERRLARYVGPIARHLVRDAARRSDSIEAICETVARNIGQTADREKFLRETTEGTIIRTGATSIRSSVRPAAATGTGIAPPGGLSPEQIERAEKALMKALGPIAKLLVKRAVPGAATETALWEKLAAHIERPADRDMFLKARPGG